MDNLITGAYESVLRSLKSEIETADAWCDSDGNQGMCASVPKGRLRKWAHTLDVVLRTPGKNARASCPPHYRGDGEVTAEDAIKSMMSHVLLPPDVAYWWGCAFKYLWRWKHKDGLQDLEKCADCLTRLIEYAKSHEAADR